MNVGRIDKMIRLVAGVLLVGFAFLMAGGFSSGAGIAAAVIGIVLIATALINFCPLYRLIGFSTKTPQ